MVLVFKYNFVKQFTNNDAALKLPLSILLLFSTSLMAEDNYLATSKFTAYGSPYLYVTDLNTTAPSHQQAPYSQQNNRYDKRKPIKKDFFPVINNDNLINRHGVNSQELKNYTFIQTRGTRFHDGTTRIEPDRTSYNQNKQYRHSSHTILYASDFEPQKK